MFYILLLTSITALILINANKIFEYEGVEISGLSDLEVSIHSAKLQTNDAILIPHLKLTSHLAKRS